MSSSGSNITIFDFINVDVSQGDLGRIIFSYLKMKDLLNLRVTSREMKYLSDLYIRDKMQPILRLPTGITYNSPTIDTIAENIYQACAVFDKEPEECTMGVVCSISYNQATRIAESDPPLEVLKEIASSEVQISLKLFFKVEIGENYQETWQSYIQTSEEVLSCLSSSISALDIDFSSRRIHVDHGNFFDRIVIIIGNLEYLRSLSISGQAPWDVIFDLEYLRSVSFTGQESWGNIFDQPDPCPSFRELTSLSLEASENDEYLIGENLVEFMNQMINLRELSIDNFQNIPAEELITCLSSMTELTSFSINDVTIINLGSAEFGQELCTALPNLSFLRLSNSWIEHEDICAIIPNIIPLLQNLETLDISKCSEPFNFFVNIGNALEGTMPNLTSLNLSFNLLNTPACINALLPTLRLLHNLEELTIRSCDIYSSGVDLLIPVLQSLPSLSFLDMSDNKLNKSSINLLRRSFRRFKQLDTSGNEPDDEESDEYSDLEDID